MKVMMKERKMTRMMWVECVVVKWCYLTFAGMLKEKKKKKKMMMMMMMMMMMSFVHYSEDEPVVVSMEPSQQIRPVPPSLC